MDAKRLLRFQRALEAKRAEITGVLGSLHFKPEETDFGKAEGDRANAALNKDILLRLSSKDHHLLSAIEGALGRVENGGFGECLNCGQEIPAKRLEALPWSRYCITCQELIEEQN